MDDGGRLSRDNENGGRCAVNAALGDGGNGVPPSTGEKQAYLLIFLEGRALSRPSGLYFFTASMGWLSGKISSEVRVADPYIFQHKNSMLLKKTCLCDRNRVICPKQGDSMSSPLLDQLMADIKDAMKTQAQTKLVALRTLHSEVKNATVNAGKDPTDEAVVQVVAKAIKQRQDAATQYRAAAREDLAIKEDAEIEIFRRYQPQQLDRPAVETIVRAAIAELGVTSKKEMGRVMQAILPKVKGRADGKMVNEIVQALLS
jgi:uncharacterized protein YqeY